MRSARRRIAARFRGIAAQAPRPAVSMRRPPTRGPRDPWTPHKIALLAIFGGCRAGPPLTGRRTRWVSMAITSTAPRTLRATPHPATPRTLPKLASGPAGGGCFAGVPAPRRAAHAAFFFIGPGGRGLATYLPGWLGSHLFLHLLNLSLFFRDRKNQRSRRFDAAAADQGSTGPLDPPCRCVGEDFRPLPRQPTLDGPALEVLLHCLHAGGHTPRCHPPCGTPRTFSRRSRCQNWLAGFPEPRTQRGTPNPPPPLTLNFSLLA